MKRFAVAALVFFVWAFAASAATKISDLTRTNAPSGQSLMEVSAVQGAGYTSRGITMSNLVKSVLAANFSVGGVATFPALTPSRLLMLDAARQLTNSTIDPATVTTLAMFNLNQFGTNASGVSIKAEAALTNIHAVVSSQAAVEAWLTSTNQYGLVIHQAGSIGAFPASSPGDELMMFGATAAGNAIIRTRNSLSIDVMELAGISNWIAGPLVLGTNASAGNFFNVAQLHVFQDNGAREVARLQSGNDQTNDFLALYAGGTQVGRWNSNGWILANQVMMARDATNDLEAVTLQQLNAFSGGGAAVGFTNAAILYVETNGLALGSAIRGNQDRPFNTVTAAVSQAQSGDVIRLGAGTFYVTSARVALPDNVSLVGQGKHATKIIGNAQLVADGLGPLVNPGDNSYIGHLTIRSTNEANFAAPIGVTPVSAHGFTNVIVESVELFGNTDNVYIDTNEYCEITFIACSLLGTFDNVFVEGHSNTLVHLVACDVLGTNLVDLTNNGSEVRNLNVYQGRLIADNCALRAYGGNSYAANLYTASAHARVWINNCSFAGGMAGAYYRITNNAGNIWIQSSSLGSGDVVGAGTTTYDGGTYHPAITNALRQDILGQWKPLSSLTNIDLALPRRYITLTNNQTLSFGSSTSTWWGVQIQLYTDSIEHSVTWNTNQITSDSSPGTNSFSFTGPTLLICRSVTNHIHIDWSGEASATATASAFANPAILYVETNGYASGTAVRGRTDLPYLSLTGAVAEAVSGDTIRVGAGKHYVIGAAIKLPDNVNLVGQGMHATEIIGNSQLVADGIGPVVQPGDNSYIGNLSITSTNEANFSSPIGITSVSARPATNVLIEAVRMFGNADNVYIDRDSQCDFTLMNCYLYSTFDNVFVDNGGAAAGTVTNNTIHLIACNIYGTNVADLAVNGSNVRNLNCFNGRIQADNCVLRAYGGNAWAANVYTADADARVWINNCSLNGGLSTAFWKITNNAGTIFLSGVDVVNSDVVGAGTISHSSVTRRMVVIQPTTGDTNYALRVNGTNGNPALTVSSNGLTTAVRSLETSSNIVQVIYTPQITTLTNIVYDFNYARWTLLASDITNIINIICGTNQLSGKSIDTSLTIFTGPTNRSLFLPTGWYRADTNVPITLSSNRAYDFQIKSIGVGETNILITKTNTPLKSSLFAGLDHVPGSGWAARGFARAIRM